MLTVTGTIKKVFDVQSGEGKKGTWHKQEFILETLSGKYTKFLIIALWGEDLINRMDLIPGLVVTCQCEVEARERNERWYTDVKAFKITWEKQARREWQ